MLARIRREIKVAAPARTVWEYVTDWPRQGEWIPMTTVESLGSPHQVGGRFRAWTGLGPVGFWDPMTITAWEVVDDGSGRCEVLHTGAVVRGGAVFAVVAHTETTCTFVWEERIAVPAGYLGAAAWKLVGPLVSQAFRLTLRRMAARAEALHADR